MSNAKIKHMARVPTLPSVANSKSITSGDFCVFSHVSQSRTFKPPWYCTTSDVMSSVSEEYRYVWLSPKIRAVSPDLGGQNWLGTSAMSSGTPLCGYGQYGFPSIARQYSIPNGFHLCRTSLGVFYRFSALSLEKMRYLSLMLANCGCICWMVSGTANWLFPWSTIGFENSRNTTHGFGSLLLFVIQLWKLLEQLHLQFPSRCWFMLVSLASHIVNPDSSFFNNLVRSAGSTFRQLPCQQLQGWSKKGNTMTFSAESLDPLVLFREHFYKASYNTVFEVRFIVINSVFRFRNKPPLSSVASSMTRISWIVLVPASKDPAKDRTTAMPPRHGMSRRRERLACSGSVVRGVYAETLFLQ